MSFGLSASVSLLHPRILSQFYPHTNLQALQPFSRPSTDFLQDASWPQQAVHLHPPHVPLTLFLSPQFSLFNPTFILHPCISRNHSVTSLSCMFHLQHCDTAQPHYSHDISDADTAQFFPHSLTLLGPPSIQRQFATTIGWFLYRNLHDCVSQGQEFPEHCRENLKLLIAPPPPPPN